MNGDGRVIDFLAAVRSFIFGVVIIAITPWLVKLASLSLSLLT